MLTGERSSIANHQVGRLLDELTIFANADLCLEIEVHAHVDTAVPEVSVERAAILVFVH